MYFLPLWLTIGGTWILLGSWERWARSLYSPPLWIRPKLPLPSVVPYWSPENSLCIYMCVFSSWALFLHLFVCLFVCSGGTHIMWQNVCGQRSAWISQNFFLHLGSGYKNRVIKLEQIPLVKKPSPLSPWALLPSLLQPFAVCWKGRAGISDLNLLIIKGIFKIHFMMA